MQNAEARMVYLKQSNQELALQVERLTKRSHRDQTKAATAERAAAQLEAQNLWLEAQLKAAMYENSKRLHQQQRDGPETVIFRATGSAPPQMQTEDNTTTKINLDPNIEENSDPIIAFSAGNSLSLSLSLSEASSMAASQKQQRNEDCNGHTHNHDNDDTNQIYNDTINNQFSFPIMSSLPQSPASSMPPPRPPLSHQLENVVRPNTYAEAITGTMNINNRLNNNNFGTNTSSQVRNRPTYGSNPRFIEICQAYNSVLTSQAAEEEPLARWVRTVMSNTSAIETDPKKVEPVLLGLKELCEENGVPMPLRKVGPSQFQLLVGGTVGTGGKESRGQKLSVRLINGRLMARSGPAWVDIFQWLERQPCLEDVPVAGRV